MSRLKHLRNHMFRLLQCRPTSRIHKLLNSMPMSSFKGCHATCFLSDSQLMKEKTSQPTSPTCSVCSVLQPQQSPVFNTT